MKNMIQRGDVMQVTVTEDVKSGDLVLVGSVVGVAAMDIAANQAGPVEVEGVFEVPKAAVGIAQGAPLYFDADGNPVGGTAGSGCLTTAAADAAAGYAFAPATTAAATVLVRLKF